VCIAAAARAAHLEKGQLEKLGVADASARETVIRASRDVLAAIAADDVSAIIAARARARHALSQ
jgi:hypothetical protein